MIELIVYCDYCKRECSNDSVDLTPVRHIKGERVQHSNKTIQLCFECFNSLFNRDMDISFMPENEIDEGFYE